MRREFSAGVVLVRRMRGRWWFAAVRPQGKRPGTWALPKGLVDHGEKPAETALREPTVGGGWESRRDGHHGRAHARHGRIGSLPPGMELEVAEARWLELEHAPRLLAYKGERDMTSKAAEMLAGDPL